MGLYEMLENFLWDLSDLSRILKILEGFGGLEVLVCFSDILEVIVGF